MSYPEVQTINVSSTMPLSTSHRSGNSRNPYCTLPFDSSIPTIPVSPLMCMPKRKGRKIMTNPGDTHPMKSYGDPVIQKPTTSTPNIFPECKRPLVFVGQRRLPVLSRLSASSSSGCSWVGRDEHALAASSPSRRFYFHHSPPVSTE
jgi:hypothetical protein